jgi:hypothetical protein
VRNITLPVSDDSYRQARIWAAKNETSVSTVQDPFPQSRKPKKRRKTTHPSPTFVPSQSKQTRYIRNAPFHPIETKHLHIWKEGKLGEFPVFGPRPGA